MNVLYDIIIQYNGVIKFQKKKFLRIEAVNQLTLVNTEYTHYHSNNSHKLNFLLFLTKVYKTAMKIFQEIKIA